YAPVVLLLPAGARSLAMGNVGVAGRDDDVLFFNPAQLIVARGTSASYERYSASSAGGTLSSVTRLTNSAIGIGARMVDYRSSLSFLSPPNAGPGTGIPPGVTPITTFPLDRESSVRPGPAQGTSIEASIGYARTVKSIRIGAAAKYVEDEIPAVKIERGTLDIGLARDFFRYYTLALSVQNIGPSTSLPCITHSEIGHENCEVEAVPAPPSSLRVPVYLPLRTTLGGSFSHQVGEFDLVSTAAVSVLRGNAVNPAAGVELGYSWIDGYTVALRGGVRRPIPGESPVTAGAGLTADRLSIDYALETLADGRIAHRFGFRIR
ncbi:MAG TPA: hypothetical protein VK636_10385, partial [Gemmatimonadaceae bacterium]|nr:hypothetical protein [Gemmatimonadaceae bacterium]